MKEKKLEKKEERNISVSKSKELNHTDDKRSKHFSESQNNSQPEFMNDKFCLFVKIVNFLTVLYILASVILYFYIHYFGKDLFKTKKTFREFDRLLFINLFYDVFLGFTIAISYISIYKKSFVLFVVYWILMIIACIFGFYGGNNNKDMINLNSRLRYIILALFAVNVLFALYPLYHYMRKIQYFRDSIESLPMDNIVHEIRLRTDMMKIGFNDVMIKLKLNKIFPNITYRKSDYYFMSDECKTRQQTAYRTLNIDEKNVCDCVEDEEHCKGQKVTKNQFNSQSTADNQSNLYKSVKSS